MLKGLVAGCVALGALSIARAVAGARVSGHCGNVTGAAASISERLAPLFIFLSPRQVGLAAVLGGLAVSALGHAAGLPSAAAVAAGLFAPLTSPFAVRLLARRRNRRVADQLPGALDMLAAGLRAGRALPQALALVAQSAAPPLGQELRLAVREAGVGKPIEVGIEGLLARCPVEDVRLTVVAITLGRTLGGDLADLLDRVTGAIRERQRLEARMRVLTAQARAQGLVLALLPVVLAVAIHAIDPDYLAPLLATELGRSILAVTAALETASLILIRRIVAVERRS